MKRKLLPLSISLLATMGTVQLNAAEQVASNTTYEEMVIVSSKKTYGNSLVTDSMMNQQSAITSVLAVIDNLPGVLINEGDTFGADDWSTTIFIRGFQNSLDSQQIGITIDGLPNGNSNYGGGAKANRFIDSENLGGVEVSQGTADIGSRSNEALGGTLNFLSSNPEREEGFRMSTTNADFEGRKYYGRYDTGEIFDNTYAYFSYSSSESSDWMDKSAENTRDHFAAKIVSEQDALTLTGYWSWDDAHEDNYQRISRAEFDQNDEWDRLTVDWTGIPYIDQSYRKGWSTLRENTFAYLKADYDLDSLKLNGSIYYHDNEGRGDWLPPYIYDAATGNRNTFVDASGNVLSYFDSNGVAHVSIPGCVSSLTFPYGGGNAAYDPACQNSSNGVIPVSSYRHTHYEKQRVGITADFVWNTQLGDVDNTLRGGFWYEDYNREESRDWHKIIDSTTAYYFDQTPYLVQFHDEYPVETMMYYLEDSADIDAVTLRLGIKQFIVDLERENLLAGGAKTSVDSDSDLLFSGGIVYRTPIEGMELFAGYSDNFAAIKDEVLGAGSDALQNIEPETATNMDVGIRYQTEGYQISAVYYDIEFDNRITLIDVNDSVSGSNDYLGSVDGTYLNVGGIESSGLELSGSFNLNEFWSVYVSYTDNDSTYLGTGNPALDNVSGVVPGNTVFGSPEEMYVVSLDWTKDKYQAGVSRKWVGERFMTLDNSPENVAPEYTVVDVYAGVSLTDLGGDIKGLDIRMTVNNLFDERYIAGVAGGSGGWLGAKRTAAVTATLEF